METTGIIGAILGLQGNIGVVVKIVVPFLGTLNIRCRIIIGIQKGTIILTTAHVDTGTRQVHYKSTALNPKPYHQPKPHQALCALLQNARKDPDGCRYGDATRDATFRV